MPSSSCFKKGRVPPSFILLTYLDSLTAVHRARGGVSPRQLERCRALLVTDNERLVRTGRDFFDRASHEWPVAILENDLVALMWVKERQPLPDLPRVKYNRGLRGRHSHRRSLCGRKCRMRWTGSGARRDQRGYVAILRYNHDAA